jgi:hypothetical protein
MPSLRAALAAAPRLAASFALVSGLALVAAGCGNAHARATTRSTPNLIVFNGTDRSLKVYVAEDESIDIIDFDSEPVATIEPGSYQTFRVEGGTHTVITERFGSGHDTHRRARLSFRRAGMCHVVTVGPYAGDREAVVARHVPPGVVVTWTPDQVGARKP